MTSLLLAFAVVFTCLELLVVAIGVDAGTSMMDRASLQLALAFVGIDLAVGAVLVRAVLRALRRPASAQPSTKLNAVSLLIPVWNEGPAIVETVAAWRAQQGVELELLLGDDGSTDDPGRWLEPLTADPRVRVFRLPHAGKGATLNVLARHARHPLLVTVDADTRPSEGALRSLAAVFEAPRVDLATGPVLVANGRDGWLAGNQSAEYLKNTFVRLGWAELGALDQLPGAFTAVRASVFHQAGGFPEDSLTEDYELSFRVAALSAARGRPAEVRFVPEAQVFTVAPTTVSGLVRQRTRWFAGFLLTLLRFKELIFAPSTGAFGMLRLPLKLVDAVLPLLAFASLVVLVRGGIDPALGISRLSLALFLVRLSWDAAVFALAQLASSALGPEADRSRAAPKRWAAWSLTLFEALTYVWLKHLGALRGALFAWRKTRTWEPSRAQPLQTDASAPEK